MKKIPLIISSPCPLLIMIIFLCIHNCLHTHFVAAQCLDHEKILLLELGQNLELGDSDSEGWNQSTDCCQWSGVECDSSSGRVIGLDLEGIYVGSIDNSSSLFRLKFLKRLNLAGNYFEGEIPSAIGKLSHLTYLNLSYAEFTGQVPIEISQLVKLVILDLSMPWIYGDGPLHLQKPNLATVVRNLTNMRELYLDGVDNSVMGNKWIQALSSSLPHLQVLSMASCQLSGKIHKSLSKLNHLSIIHLDGNSNLTGPVPVFLARLPNLTKLTLSNCGLSGSVPRKLFQVPTLQTLDLGANFDLQGTLPDFYKNGSLEELSLDLTHFSGLLPNSIGNLVRLRKFDLSNCDFHGSIPSSISSLNLLEDVNLCCNNFFGPIPSFSVAKNLKTLALDNNNLNGSINATEWAKLLSLEELHMSDNSLDGSIPESLLALPSLQYLFLDQNKFSGQLKELTSSLTMLDLSSNEFEGMIPNSLFQLSELSSLTLSSNRFNGTLKLAVILHNFKNLMYLELSHNRFSIDMNDCRVNSSFPQLWTVSLASCNLYVIPEFLRNQTWLIELDLSMNQISGTVPSWMWKLGYGQLNLSHNHLVHLEPPLAHGNTSAISFLDLHANNLQGEFPVLSSQLELLDCSNNNFTSINPNIGSYSSKITFLSFQHNFLFGSIPVALCNATSLEFLTLAYNHLDGMIPDCLISMSTLLMMNLRGNYLNGAIPDKFGKDCNLRTLSLNGNILQGRIPGSLANCRELMLLDLGNNQLNDTFPCHLERLPKMKVLILRSNKFHGTIFSSRSAWPLLKVVDLASNHFSGELKPKMHLKWTSMMMERKSKMSIETDGLSSYDSRDGYYQNSVALTFKGNIYELQQNLAIFISIDFSNNAFHGELPRELGNLDALKVLNLSHNSFSGDIPPSIGNLSQIESLDLSYNTFRGNIPPQIANLNFLEYLNLSFNQLSGKIPTGTQLQSFPASSYKGNEELYGPPLTPITGIEPRLEKTPPGSAEGSHWSSKSEIEWMLKGAEVGFPVGIIIFLGTLLYIKRWEGMVLQASS